MKLQVSDVTGPALDWAVAKAAFNCSPTDVSDDICGTWYEGENVGGVYGWGPSTNWFQCGPLLERFRLGIYQAAKWAASADGTPNYSSSFDEESCGSTAPIAVCRAIVREKLGDVVDAPENVAAAVRR